MEELNKGYEFTKAQIAELESFRAENERLKQIKSRNKSVELLAENETLRARLAELEKQEPVGPIEHDADMDRYYIPVHAKWEVQTKGKGSSFRIANCETGDRWLVADKHLHSMLEKMARDINAAPVVSPDVAALKAERDYHLTNAKFVYAECSELKAEIQSLKTEIEAARKDAERYRWLREHDVTGHTIFKICRTPSEIDAAIEQAKGGV